MTLATSPEKLATYGFALTHQCKLDQTRAKFTATTPRNTHLQNSNEPMVYLWVAPRAQNELEILYVGKAGAGVATRLRQHENGFINSSTGKKNLDLIKTIIDGNTEIFVYSRISAKVNIHGICVSQYSTEEEAFIQLFSPSWNRARMTNPTAAKIGVVASVTNDVALPPNIENQGLDNIDISGIPNQDLLRDFYDATSQQRRAKFCRLLQWALSLQATSDLGMRIIAGYTGQPALYNGIPTITFAKFGENNRATADSWLVRIPLPSEESTPLSVTLPERCLVNGDVEGLIMRGNCKNFCPLDLEDFLGAPAKYTTLS